LEKMAWKDRRPVIPIALALRAASSSATMCRVDSRCLFPEVCGQVLEPGYGVVGHQQLACDPRQIRL
jgi:hypothetical protein